MQLRMLNRRSLNGSMTVVGDIAQSTGAWAHADWEEILEQLPDRRPPRRAELTIGYRLPGPNMALAAQVLALAAPGLRPPSLGARRPATSRGSSRPSTAACGAAVVAAALDERDAVDPGSVAVIVPDSLVGVVGRRLRRGRRRVRPRRAQRPRPARSRWCRSSLVKGLELDASVVVEPAAILEEEAQGARALYVALTRATKRLVLVHDRPLPDVLLEGASV